MLGQHAIDYLNVMFNYFPPLMVPVSNVFYIYYSVIRNLSLKSQKFVLKYHTREISIQREFLYLLCGRGPFC